MVWQSARDEAQQLRRRYQTGHPYEICRRLGIDVFEVSMPTGVSGMIVKAHGEDAQIFIERADVVGRRRFTCAHELGHFVERVNVAGDDDFSFRDKRAGGTYNLHEFFADEFAGELLMPAERFEPLLRDGRSATYLAAEFDVTASAALQRARRLRRDPSGS